MGQDFDQKDIRVIGYNKGGTFFYDPTFSLILNFTLDIEASISLL